MMHSVREAERAVLGSILLDNGALIAVRTLLAPEDFAEGEHRAIYTAMLARAGNLQPVDVVTLATALGDNSGTKLASLVGLSEAVPTSANVEHYARLVADASLRRRIAAAGGEISKSVGASEDPREMLSARITQLTTLLEGPMTRAVPVSEIAIATFDELERVASGKEQLKLVPTGLTGLDRRLGGLGHGELWVIGARPGVGKTGLGLAIAQSVAEAGYRALFISLEMTATQLGRRILAHESGLSSSDLRRAQLSDEDWPALVRAVGALEQVPLAVLDRSRITIGEVSAACELAAVRGWGPHQQRLGVVVIDYLQLVRAGMKTRSREEEVAEVSRTLKSLAKAIETPVVALAQINREVDKRPPVEIDCGPGNAKVRLHVPKVSDLRESGSIEADADVILLPHREHVFDSSVDPEEAWIFVGKGRESGTGHMRCRFNKRSTLWEDA